MLRSHQKRFTSLLATLYSPDYLWFIRAIRTEEGAGLISVALLRGNCSHSRAKTNATLLEFTQHKTSILWCDRDDLLLLLCYLLIVLYQAQFPVQLLTVLLSACRAVGLAVSHWRHLGLDDVVTDLLQLLRKHQIVIIIITLSVH